MPPGLEVLTPQLKQQFEQTHARVSQNKESIYLRLFPKAMALERAFARAGGMLVAGTDPTGGGGVIPGYSNQRQVELLVDAGFTPLEAITIGTLNGAQLSRTREEHRQYCGRQTGRPRRPERRPVGHHRRRAQGRDRLPAGHRLRPGEVDRLGQRAGWDCFGEWRCADLRTDIRSGSSISRPSAGSMTDHSIAESMSSPFA